DSASLFPILFLLTPRRPPTPTPFPYTTLFRSLEAIRLKIMHLYDDFLQSDFGFDPKSMRLAFSGGRGYHIHVFDERVWSLGSHRSEEHTSELQSRVDLVCRLLLEKKKKIQKIK